MQTWQAVHRKRIDAITRMIATASGHDIMPPPSRCGNPQRPVLGVIMGWIVLLIAGMFEVVGAVGLNYAKGFTRPIPSVITLAGFAASFGLLTLSLKNLPLGTAYAVWTGIGTVGTAIAGVVLFHEPATLARILSIALIVAGIVGLKLVTTH